MDPRLGAERLADRSEATGEERRSLAAAPSGVRAAPGRVVLGQGTRRHRGQRTGRRTGNAGYAGSDRYLRMTLGTDVRHASQHEWLPLNEGSGYADVLRHHTVQL